MKRGSSFGMVVLLVVVAVVLLLVAKNWKAISSAAPAVASGDVRQLPGMKQTKGLTDKHAAELQGALDEAEKTSKSGDGSDDEEDGSTE